MSLTESCIAVTIVSITMAMASPSLIRARETYVLQSEARSVAAKLHAARVLAVVRNRDCRIVVPTPVSYFTECQSSATSQWHTTDTTSLPEGFTITANAKPEFHRHGNVSPAATLTVCNRFLRCLRIVVNVNGRVRIQ
jgi:Tfp pilus assembly protein FimT